MHPIEDLWARHHPPMGYPDGVLPIPEPIPGLAFFPGGFGLWGSESSQPLPPLPVGGVMVLGHDFHSEAGYHQSLQQGSERLTLPTWSNLLKLLTAANLSPEHCFFTNLYMGLRAGTATTEPFPGAVSPEFVAHCQTFFLEQLRIQWPSLVITLGVHVPPIIAALSPELAPWALSKGIKHLDTVGPVRSGVTFSGVLGFSTTVVALLHPSLRHASLRHRRYKEFQGAEAELQMLQDGLRYARISSS